MYRSRIFSLVACVGVCAALLPAGALADDQQGGNQQGGGQTGERTFTCRNEVLGPILIDADLVVPAGARCELLGTHVTGSATVSAGPPAPAEPTSLSMTGATIDGDVRVQRNAQFAAFAGSTVGGDVRCNRCEVADLEDSTVKGSHVENAVSQGAFIRTSHVGGTLSIHDSTDFLGTGFHLDGNTVGENLEFNRNQGASDISGNRIAEDLVCFGNTPPPTGGGNTAQHKRGQCRLL